MALLIYAELADLEPLLTAELFDPLTAETVAPGLIHASYLVREATKNDIYSTDEDGYALNERKREGFRLATAEQVAWWVRTGVDLATLDLGDANATPSVASTSINGATVQLDNSAKQQALLQATERLVPRAAYYLRNAGLGSGLIGRVYG